MSELQSGYIEKLVVIGEEGSRWLLEAMEQVIKLNKSEAPEDVQIEDEVEAFIYTNRRGELTATMQLPNMTCETYGWATVTRVDPREGVYVDIGSSFEVLVNGADMPRIRSLWPKQGDALYMTLRTDLGGNIFGRLITEERMLEFIYEKAPTTINNANIKARAYRLLPVGSFFLSIPENYRVFVHNTEQKSEPRLGEEVDVRIIKVHDDGTLNGSLLPRIEERMSGDSAVVYDYLVAVGGRMPFTDKSTPDEIREMFDMSKGSFKRALGKLMKERKVIQEEGWTNLVEQED